MSAARLAASTTLAKVRRHDEEAEAQRRKQRLAEAADIDHATVDVETVQAGNGPRAEAELAVVVVLDDPRARGARPCQQRQPPRQAHGHAERKLMRWRDVGETRIAAPGVRRSRRSVPARRRGWAGCARRPRPVRRARRDSRAPPSTRRRPDRGAGDRRAPVRAALRRRRPPDRRHRTCHARGARGRQSRRAIRRGPPGHRSRAGQRDRPQSPAGEPCPHLNGEAIERGRPDAERARRTGDLQRRARRRCQRSAPSRDRRVLPGHAPCGDTRARPIVGQLTGDECARARPRGEIALGRQLIEGEHGSRPRDPEIGGQRAR